MTAKRTVAYGPVDLRGQQDGVVGQLCETRGLVPEPGELRWWWVDGADELPCLAQIARTVGRKRLALTPDVARRAAHNQEAVVLQDGEGKVVAVRCG